MSVSISKEDYIKAIAELEAEGESAIAATVARWVNVTPAAVTMAVKRLKRDGFVDINKNGRLRLTAEGKSVAERIRLRHHLIERMLVHFFGMEWFKVHDEAERLEHAVSDDFLEKLIERLGSDGRCPHGNDIRGDTPADRRDRGWCRLTEYQSGNAARVVSVFERDRRLLEHFDKLGIRPGVVLTVIAHNYDDTLTLQVDGTRVPLGKTGANRVWVAGIPASPST